MSYLGSAKNKADKAKWQREWRKRNRAATRDAWHAWEKKNGYDHPEAARRHHLRLEYGITPEDYDRMFEEQRGVCAICGLPPTEKVFVVDHDHLTGKVRGLLHRTCNSAIGIFNDDPALLRKAADYLEDLDAI